MQRPIITSGDVLGCLAINAIIMSCLAYATTMVWLACICVVGSVILGVSCAVAYRRYRYYDTYPRVPVHHGYDIVRLSEHETTALAKLEESLVTDPVLALIAAKRPREQESWTHDVHGALKHILSNPTLGPIVILVTMIQLACIMAAFSNSVVIGFVCILVFGVLCRYLARKYL